MQEVNPKLVGGFIIGAVLLIIVVFVVFGSGQYFKEKTKYVTYFRGSIGGLYPGSDVKVRGVKIGSVLEITPFFEESGDFLVEVIIETDDSVIKTFNSEEITQTPEEELKELIRLGLRVQLQTESMITGQLSIKADYFPDTPAMLTGLNRQYPEIPSIPTKAAELEAKIERSINSLSEIQFAEISTSLLQTLQGLDTLIRSPELKKTIQSLDRSLITTSNLMSDMDNKIDTLTTAFVQSSNSINELLKRTQNLVSHIDDIATSNRYELNETLKELAAASQAMSDLADYLQRHPESLLRGKN